MKKFLAALFLSLFAVSSSVPVIAAEKKEDKKTQKKQDQKKTQKKDQKDKK